MRHFLGPAQRRDRPLGPPARRPGYMKLGRRDSAAGEDEVPQLWQRLPQPVNRGIASSTAPIPSMRASSLPSRRPPQEGIPDRTLCVGDLPGPHVLALRHKREIERCLVQYCGKSAEEAAAVEEGIRTPPGDEDFTLSTNSLGTG